MTQPVTIMIITIYIYVPATVRGGTMFLGCPHIPTSMRAYLLALYLTKFISLVNLGTKMK